MTDANSTNAARPAPGIVPEFALGDRLRKARELTGLGVREFASRLGISHQTVTNAEKGHRAVRRITLQAWATHTGVDLNWLETGSTMPEEN